MSSRQRLDRLLAARSGDSRKDVRKLIKSFRVTVDGQTVRNPAEQITEGAVVCIDDVPLLSLPPMVVWHKPLGVLSTFSDPMGRSGLEGALPPEWANQFHPVGRLDADTTGLLLFSRLGGVTQWLLHPKRAVERAYEATVEGEADGALAQTLSAGVETGEGTFTAKVEARDGRWLRLAVTEGKHRMVRRMLANAGHPVLTLHRVRYGQFHLADLPEGESRALHDDELEWLKKIRAPLGQ